MRRSTAIVLLTNMKESGLLTEEEFSPISPETREGVEVIIGSVAGCESHEIE